MSSFSKSNVDVLTELRAFDTSSQQSVTNKLLTIVSPEDYGALGNGSADDTSAFAAAFAASTVVTCKAGKTYIVSGTIAVPANTIFDLNNSTIKRKAGSTNIFDMVSVGSNSTVKNGIIDGNKAADSLSSANATQRFSGIKSVGSSFVVIENLLVKNTVNNEDARAAIFLDTSTNLRIDKCVTTANDKCGIYVNASTDIQVTNCKSYSNTGNGFSSVSTTSLQMSGNHFYSNSAKQAWVRGLYPRIINNKFSSGASGQNLLQVGENVSGGYATDAIVSDNTFHTASGAAALVISGSDNVSLSKLKFNIISPGSGVGVINVDNSNNLTVSDVNVPVAGAGYGLYVIGGTAHKIISGSFSGATTGIMLQNGSSATVGEAVKCFNNTYSGLSLSSYNDVVISGEYYDSQVTRTQDYGIDVGGSNGITLLNVYCHDNTVSPVTSLAGSYERVRVKRGSNLLSGTFTVGNGTATATIANDNADSNMTVIVTPTNAAAAVMFGRVLSIADGTNFVMQYTANAVGDATFAYRIV